MPARRWRAVASAPVRVEPEAFTIAIAGKPETSSTTIRGLGGHVLVIATTLPDRALGLRPATSASSAARSPPHTCTEAPDATNASRNT